MASTNFDAAEKFYEEHGDPNILKYVYLRHKNSYKSYLSNTYSKSNFEGGFLQPSPVKMVVDGAKSLFYGVADISITLFTMLTAPILVSLYCVVEAYKNKQHIQNYIDQAEDI